MDETVRKGLRAMTQPGYGILIVGEKGGGKTHTATFVSAFHLLDDPKHNHVVSNIRICRRGTGPPDEDESEYPERYHRVQTQAAMFFVISEILRHDSDANILFVLDEAAMFLGYLDYISGMMKSTVKLNTLTRKLKIASVFIAVRAELIGKKFRDTSGLIDVTLSKDKSEIRRYAWDILQQGYDMKQVALVDWPEHALKKEPIIIERAPILTTPPNECKPGQLYFDTMSLATFDPGVHPVTHKEFNVQDLILVLSSSDLPRTKTLELFYRYMHEDPVPMVRTARETLYGFGGETPAYTLPAEDSSGRIGTKTDWKRDAVIETLRTNSGLNNAELARLVSRPNDAVSPQYVGRVRRELQVVE